MYISSHSNRIFWWNALSMFYGGALGDALAFPFEHCYNNNNNCISSKTDHLKLDQYRGKLEYPPSILAKKGVIGQTSDATDRIMVLCYSIIENGEYNAEMVSLEYEKWDIEKDIQSDVSLMRSAVFALFPGEKYQNVIMDVDLTNSDDLNREIGLIYVKILRELLLGKNGLYPLKDATIPEIINVIEQAQRGEIRDFIPSKNKWIVNSFYCALYCLFHFSDYMSAIHWVIRIGGNAVVVGHLMGAKMGYKLFFVPQIETNLQILLTADPSPCEISQFGRYHAAHFSNITMDFCAMNPLLKFKNDNIVHTKKFYENGKTPVIMKQSAKSSFAVYFFLPKEMVGEVEIQWVEDELYNAQFIKLEQKMSIEDFVDNVDEKCMDLFEAYRLLYLFVEALRDRALDEINAKIKLIDPLDKNFDILYARDFFLLNE